MTKSKQKLNFIDVFSGAGGLSCGMEMASWRCVLGVDHDKYAMETFAHNHKSAEVYCGDIRKLTKKKLTDLTKNQEVHAVVGGPPCQGFSTVGRGNPEDARNNLFLQFVRIVKETNPYFVIIENVTGLLAKKNEKSLNGIFRKFATLGFNMNVQVMSSQHYGVPEKRRRTIIIGSRINETITYPNKTHDIEKARKYVPAMSVAEAFKSLKDKKGVIHNHDLDMAGLKHDIDKKRLARIPEGCGIRYERDEKKYFTPRLKLGVDWETLPENRFRQTKYQRLDSKGPGPTIMTHRHNYYHPKENRYLTQREAAAVQSFPNNFIFKGPVSAQWRQIGNAVPPLLGKALGRTLLKMHKSAQKIGTKSLSKLVIKKKISEIRGSAFHYRKSSES